MSGEGADDPIDRLRFHTLPEPGAFLAMLRPYCGIREDILIDVRLALQACADRFQADQLPHELVTAAWAISHLGRLWALSPDGMLRRNKLITVADQERLAAFLDEFDEAVFLLLEGARPA